MIIRLESCDVEEHLGKNKMDKKKILCCFQK